MQIIFQEDLNNQAVWNTSDGKTLQGQGHQQTRMSSVTDSSILTTVTAVWRPLTKQLNTDWAVAWWSGNYLLGQWLFNKPVNISINQYQRKGHLYPVPPHPTPSHPIPPHVWCTRLMSRLPNDVCTIQLKGLNIQTAGWKTRMSTIQSIMSWKIKALLGSCEYQESHLQMAAQVDVPTPVHGPASPQLVLNEIVRCYWAILVSDPSRRANQSSSWMKTKLHPVHRSAGNDCV